MLVVAIFISFWNTKPTQPFLCFWVNQVYIFSSKRNISVSASSEDWRDFDQFPTPSVNVKKIALKASLISWRETYALKMLNSLKSSLIWPTTKMFHVTSAFPNCRPKKQKKPTLKYSSYFFKNLFLFCNECSPIIKLFVPPYTPRWLLIKCIIRNFLIMWDDC